MTIALCLKVGDGVVFGADSASTLMSQHGVMNVYFNAEKIFNLVKGLPIGAVTYGLGSLRQRSISSLAKDLRKRLKPGGEWALDPESYTMEQVAERVREFFYEELYRRDFPVAERSDAEEPAFPSMGFTIAGFSAGAQQAEVWSVEVDTTGACDRPRLVYGEDASGVVRWNGEPEALNRLLLGISSDAFDRLIAAGVPTGEIMNLLASYQPLAYPGMPIQDAIDLVQYLADTTVGFVRFRTGAPTVAPPIDIAAITLYEKFRWVKRKHYFSPELNPLFPDPLG
jgi:hypothetical protein